MAKQVSVWTAETDGRTFDTESAADAHDKANNAKAWVVKYLANTGKYKTLARAEAAAANQMTFVAAFLSFQADGDLLEMPEFKKAEEQLTIPTDTEGADGFVKGATAGTADNTEAEKPAAKKRAAKK